MALLNFNTNQAVGRAQSLPSLQHRNAIDLFSDEILREVARHALPHDIMSLASLNKRYARVISRLTIIEPLKPGHEMEELPKGFASGGKLPWRDTCDGCGVVGVTAVGRFRLCDDHVILLTHALPLLCDDIHPESLVQLKQSAAIDLAASNPSQINPVPWDTLGLKRLSSSILFSWAAEAKASWMVRDQIMLHLNRWGRKRKAARDFDSVTRTLLGANFSLEDIEICLGCRAFRSAVLRYDHIDEDAKKEILLFAQRTLENAGFGNPEVVVMGENEEIASTDGTRYRSNSISLPVTAQVSAAQSPSEDLQDLRTLRLQQSPFTSPVQAVPQTIPVDAATSTSPVAIVFRGWPFVEEFTAAVTGRDPVLFRFIQQSLLIYPEGHLFSDRAFQFLSYTLAIIRSRGWMDNEILRVGQHLFPFAYLIVDSRRQSLGIPQDDVDLVLASTELELEKVRAQDQELGRQYVEDLARREEGLIKRFNRECQDLLPNGPWPHDQGFLELESVQKLLNSGRGVEGWTEVKDWVSYYIMFFVPEGEVWFRS